MGTGRPGSGRTGQEPFADRALELARREGLEGERVHFNAGLGPLRRARRVAARRRPRRHRAPRSPGGALLVPHAGARLPVGRPAGGRDARGRAGRAGGARGTWAGRSSRATWRASRRPAASCSTTTAAQAAARERIATLAPGPALGARPPARWWNGARACASCPAAPADRRVCAAPLARSTCARCRTPSQERGRPRPRARAGREAPAPRAGPRLSGYRARRDNRRLHRGHGVRAAPEALTTRLGLDRVELAVLAVLAGAVAGCAGGAARPRAGRSRAPTACSPPTSSSTSPGSARRPSTG